MASIRLTQTTRYAICRAAISASFDSRFEKLAKEEDRLGRQIYNKVFPLSERRAAGALPDNWLRADKCLHFNVGGMRMQFDLQGEGVPVPYRARGSESGGYSCQNLGSVTDETLIEAARAHFNRVEDTKKEKERAKSALQNLLESVTTVKTLTEVWPEGTPYYSNITAPEPTVPAPIVADINAMLGLAQIAEAA